MKKQIVIIGIVAFLAVHSTGHAQDSSKQSAREQINKTSEASDKANAKRIQQQTLSNKQVEMLGSPATLPVKKKTIHKQKRKH